MQFEIDDDFQLDRFDGAGLALTRNSSPASAWRLGVSLDGHTSSGDVTGTSSNDSGTTPTSYDLPEDDHFGIGLDLLRLKRFHPDRRFDLELGVGPRIVFDHSKTTQQSSIGDVGISTDEIRSSTQQYGVIGRLGVEVFVARSLSLHAHYGTFFGYRHLSQTIDSDQAFYDGTARHVLTDQTLNQWSLDNLGVTLGVSAYL
jgi:hypothetical protein